MGNFNYDYILVGAGPSSIFTAYKLIQNDKNAKIVIFEKGKSIFKRTCPKRQTGVCVNCSPCNITSGFSGAGAFSDGKLTLATSEIGGTLSEVIGEEDMQKYMNEMDEVYLKFGATKELHGISDKEAIRKIRKKAIQANMRLIECPIRHLGTESSLEIYGALEKYLIENGVEIKFSSPVSSIVVEDGKASGVYVKDEFFPAKKIIVGAGREGSVWFKKMCEINNIKTTPGTVDIGVRVECRNEIMQELNDAMYESKLIYHSKTYADKVRTFCQNPSGEVALENYTLPDNTHITTVNGHAYKDKNLKTDNTNFALLVSKNFTTPFKEPLEYGVSYAKIANMLAGGTVLLQTLGDLKRFRRSTPERIKYGNCIPTLKSAVPGDLASVMPHRILTSILEMLEGMDTIAPGINNDETLLYGIEVKFYSNKVLLDENFETSVKNLYCIGDCSSVTHGLSNASAMGLYLGDKLNG